MAINFLLTFCLLAGIQALADFRVPSLGSRHVVDEAGVIGYKAEESLQGLLSNVKSQFEIEMVILTIDSLSGLPIETVSIKIVDQWKLGTGKGDKGLLLLIAPNDRQVRIEVGQGLEGDITDLESSRVINDYLVPYFRNGDFDGAALAGTYQLLKLVVDQNYLNQLANQYEQPASDQPVKFFQSHPKLFILLIIFVIFIHLIGGGGRGFRRRGLIDPLGGFGGGRGGFGGGFGGGLGGGGGFSGGGASGRW